MDKDEEEPPVDTVKRRQGLGLASREQIPLYIFVFVLFATGVAFGAMMTSALTLEQQQELSRYLTGFFQTVDQGIGFDEGLSFKQSLSLHLKWIVLIYVLGLSVIGLPLVFALDFLKGVLIGFSVGFLVGEFSLRGLLFTFVSIVPQNLLIIPAIVVCSVAAGSFSIQMFRSRFLGQGKPLSPLVLHYTRTLIVMAVVIALAACYEAYASQHLMRLVTPMLLGS